MFSSTIDKKGKPLIVRLISKKAPASISDPEIEMASIGLSGIVHNGKTGIKGATVRVKGTKIATTTDLDGNFSLTLPSKDYTIVISYTGYKTKEVNVFNPLEILSGKPIRILLQQ